MKPDFNKEKFNKEDFIKKLKKASTIETTCPGYEDNWDKKDNPAWGQCTMYALAYDSKLDELGITNKSLAKCYAITKDNKKYLHLINIVEGKIEDLSKSQFKGDVKYENIEEVSKKEVLSWKDKEKERFQIFQKNLSDLS